MEIPSITEQDLIDFHKAHFPSAPLPSQFFVQPHAVGGAVEEEDYGPYGLGYYVDGEPRTLDDDDVAWFRDREIRLLLKKRRLRRARAEEEAAEAASRDAHVDEVDLSPGQVVPESTHDSQTPLDTSSKAPVGKLSEPKSPAVSGSSGNASDSAAVPSTTGPNPKTLKRKQQRERRFQTKQPKTQTNPEDYTPRRIARELDEAAEASVELDY